MALTDWRTESNSAPVGTANIVQKCTADPNSHSLISFEHLAHFYSYMEFQRDKRLADARRLSIGCARVLIENSKPCRCSGITSFGNCHLWHNYRPLKESVEELIHRLVYNYEDSSTIIVTIAPAILRFCKNEGVILCKDQYLRLISVAICVNAKFWDDKAPLSRQNSRIAAAVGVPLDDFNAMEMAFLRGLGWNLCLSAEDFEHWSKAIEERAEAHQKALEDRLEMERRNQSPTVVTDLVEALPMAALNVVA
mmetsp:Transcript_7511/g.16162  ORF Transcript_7511/g.16162 Transcript_7511/m.16162 type:complete len:252 (-) Transcript_7511:477-1232(-)